ncbi:hypothetical protein [Hydrogenobacter hydrogenophilus]|uniref:Outer membrane lipoprotein-sorting protein n=1 Tax=Hydrogenobacter hydrogenophilus TaxID=35835 RepID=A0A285NZ71_9AQUI|nr:hypothetical protein [Hydrogenobacter hydrogenophilus]SNZ14760.1 hypothetical protein SAMN06265353_1195 [Hydrogenobacter hydrogenophilus]
MKKALFLCVLCLAYACAPLVCPGEKEVRQVYSEDSAPKSYNAFVSLRYGILKVPIYIEKAQNGYTLRSPQTGTVLFKDTNLCVGATCIDLPLTPDALIFGTVLTGEEKASCSLGSLAFERDDGLYKRKYIFSNGQLKRVELIDKKRDRLVVLDYPERNKQGYYRNVKISVGDISFNLSVDQIDFRR